MDKKVCLECGSGLQGRSDRKFCSDGCRVSYNNRKYGAERKGIREINRILFKNYAILKETLETGFGTCPTSYLFRKGFNFDYLTSLTDGEEGHPLIMGCYEFRYHVNSKGIVSISVKEEPD